MGKPEFAFAIANHSFCNRVIGGNREICVRRSRVTTETNQFRGVFPGIDFAATFRQAVLTCHADSEVSAEDALVSAVETRELKVASSSGGPSHVISRSDVAYQDISARVAALEQTAGFGPSRDIRRFMPGTWRLAATDSDAVARNAGSLTGVSKLPGTRCTRVEVVLQPEGTAQTVESITTGVFLRTVNSLVGKWSLTGNPPIILEVTYAQARLFNRINLRADSKAVLRTTYCSQTVRIGRSRSGDFYVFIRQ